MEAAKEVEVQLDRRSLLVRVAAEVEVQRGSGSSIEVAAVVVGVEGAAAEVEKATLSNLLKYWLKVLALSSSPSTD